MVGIAGLVALLGYAMLFYGLAQVQGENNSFFDYLNFSKPFVRAPKDSA